MSLELLNFSAQDIELYTTSYADISRYKTLRVLVKSTHECYLSISYSVDCKTDSITQSYHVAANRWTHHKTETIADFARIKIVAIDENSLIDMVEVSAKGRVAVSSGINKLIERFSNIQPIDRELELADEKKERKNGIYARLGLGKTHETKTIPKPVNECKIPQLLLRGQLLYCDYNGRLCTLPPPPEDGKSYILAMKNKVPYWVNSEEAPAWF